MSVFCLFPDDQRSRARNRQGPFAGATSHLVSGAGHPDRQQVAQLARVRLPVPSRGSLQQDGERSSGEIRRSLHPRVPQTGSAVYRRRSIAPEAENR